MIVNLFSNVFSTIVTIIAPLVTIPILTDALGLHAYGVYVSALSFGTLISVFLDFGFGMYLPKAISNANENKEINVICSSFFVIKILCVPVIVIANSLAFSEHFYKVVALSILLTLNPTPLLIAFERYKKVALITLVSKTLYLFLIVIMVNYSVSIENAINSMTASLLTVLIWSVYHLIHYEGVKLSWIKMDDAKKIMIGSFGFYSARLFVNIYQQSSTYFVSLILPSSEVSIYSIALQFYKLGQGMIGAMSKVLYTTMLRTKDIKILKVFVSTQIMFWAIGLIVLQYVINDMLSLFFDFDIAILEQLIKEIYLGLVLVIISSAIGYPFLTPLNKERIANSTIFINAVLYYTLFLFMYVSGLSGLSSLVFIVIFSELGSMLPRLRYYFKFKELYNISV